MSEKLVNSIIVSLSERFSNEDLEFIQFNLIRELNNYEIKEKCTGRMSKNWDCNPE